MQDTKVLRPKETTQDIDHDYIGVSTENNGVMTYSSDPTVSIADAEAWEKELLADPRNRFALNALLSNDVRTIVSNKVATLTDTQTFNIKIPFEGSPVTNQRASGRCWLFATTNVLRVPIMKKYNLKEFELSQSYLFFWDKLEKANWFLEQAMETSEEDLDSRLVQELLTAPVNDGGQWDMAANLVAKYGLVPQCLYPDSHHATSSASMGQLITTKLRENALVLRSMKSSPSTTSQSSLLSVKAKMMQEIHTMLTLMLGPPPKPHEKFTWEYYDKDEKYHNESMTPVELAKDLSSSSAVRMTNANVSEFFSLVNDPRNDYNQLLTVDRLGNVVGGRPVTYVNVDMNTMKTAAIAMLKAGLPVFFGSDVGKFMDTKAGILDPARYDYDLAFNVKFGLDKAQRLKAKESMMTHAMVLTGVQIEDGKSVRWRVMNSWGEDSGTKGYYVASDKWMDEFTYQIVVDPSYVSKEIRDVLNQEAKVLPLWDPMGSLA